MKNARIWFRKFGECKYISHLDLNRVMLRAVQKSGLDVWHTEGYNRHAYITFALPLSLGQSSVCETMDFRLNDDNEDMDAIPARLNASLPHGLEVLCCREPVMKPALIDSAVYKLFFAPEDVEPDALCAQLDAFTAQDVIPVEKKSKKGLKTVDLKPMIRSCEVTRDEGVTVTLTLPAGSVTNINPALFIAALERFCGKELYCTVERCAIRTKEGEDFA